jgi:Zn ribbon nucleic-acid-binding protein
MECPDCNKDMEGKPWGGDDIRYVCIICGKNIYVKIRKEAKHENPENS